jgi:hypothetical protein
MINTSREVESFCLFPIPEEFCVVPIGTAGLTRPDNDKLEWWLSISGEPSKIHQPIELTDVCPKDTGIGWRWWEGWIGY